MPSLNINLLSDSLGNTAEQVANAARAQFGVEDVSYRKFSFIEEGKKLEKCFEEILSQENPVILYTIVTTEIIEKIEKFAKENDIKAVDLLSPTINAIQETIKMEPFRDTGMLRKLNSSYFKRVECIEFAVRYDDGKDPRGVLKADLVLLGISRTSKTPLSMYLANKNIKVCNIPLVPESIVPNEIYEVPSSKIVGLTNSPQKLNQIRKERLNTLGLPNGSSYATMDRILEEISYAEEIMKRIGCLIIDVSNKAIEETAEIAIAYLKKNGFKFNNED